MIEETGIVIPVIRRNLCLEMLFSVAITFSREMSEKRIDKTTLWFFIIWLYFTITYYTKSMKILENFDTQMKFSDPHRTTTSNKELDNHHETMAANYEVLADIYHQNKDYVRALEYYNKALHIFETVTPRIPICLQRSPSSKISSRC